MGLKDKLMAKSAGVKEQVDAEMSKTVTDKSGHPRTAIGHAGAFQVAMGQSEARIKELEARVADLERTSIPITAIQPNPWQPRLEFKEAELNELAASIAEIGLIQPVILRRVPNPDTLPDKSSVPNPDTYQIVAGERRWRAHSILGLTEIKAIVAEVSDDEMIAVALAENFDRQDLTAYEMAVAIKYASDRASSKKDLAKSLGIARSELYRYLSFFSLPDFVLDDLKKSPGILGRDAAEAIVSVIKNHGEPATYALAELWPHVLSGALDQGKIAPSFEAAITKGAVVRTDRDIRKLFVNKEHAGSITRDSNSLTIKIKTVVLVPEKESRLRDYVERLLAEE